MSDAKHKTSDHAKATPPEPVSEHIIGTILLGLTVALGLIGGMVFWSMTARIDGAIIAPAKFEVEGSRKTVQHLEGGIVSRIAVKEGELVAAGQTLIHLDRTAARAELDIVRNRHVGLLVRRARLEAALDGARDFDLPATALARADEPALAAAIDTERRLLAASLEAQQASADLTDRRVAALRAQIDGLAQQKTSALHELGLIEEARVNLSSLLEQQLVQADRVLTLQRDMAQLEGSVSGAEAQAISLDAQILEARAQHEQTVATERGAVAEELSQVQSELQSLQEQAVILQDRLVRNTITSPYAGRVLNLAVKTEGAVIAPGAPVMEVVPIDEDLILNARIDSTDVERIAVDQSARIRLTAFNQNVTPELTGHVVSVSADVLVDPDSGQAFYKAKIALPPDQLALVDDVTLKPGMPAEVLVSTGDRLAASYLLRPLRDAYQRSFRDE